MKQLLKKIEKPTAIVAVLIILAFFCVAIFSLTKSGEDIWQTVDESSRTPLQSAVSTFNLLPRIGEIYHKVTARWYTYQFSFGTDFIFRSLDVLLAFFTVYFTTCVCLGRRFKLKYTDTFLVLFVFIALLATRYSFVFLGRFNFIHNYLIVATLIALFADAFFNWSKKSKISYLCSFVIAFLLATSNEITPVALLLMFATYIIYRFVRYRQSPPQLIRKYPRQFWMFLGLCCGTIFLFGNGAIFSRSSIDGAYGLAYGAVSFSDLFHSPVHFVIDYLNRLLYNCRTLFPPIFALALAVSFEASLIKRSRRPAPKSFYLQICCLVYAILFLLASSKIFVLSDLEARFYLPPYTAIIIGIGISVYHLLDSLKLKFITQTLAVFTALGISLIMLADVIFYSVHSYRKYGELLSDIQFSPDTTYCITPSAAAEENYSSPIFGFYQIPPVESWLTDQSIYDKTIIYSETCK